MTPFPYWQDYPLTLTSGASVVTFDAHGDWLACYQAQEEFDLSVEGGSPLKFNQGLRMGWPETRRVTVRVTPKPGATVFPNSIVLRFGVGAYVDNRFSVSAPLQIASGAVIQEKAGSVLDAPAADVVLVANTNTTIFPANAARRACRVKNLSGTASVRLSSSAADLTAGRGYLLDPAAEVVLEITGQLLARSAGTPTLNLSEIDY